MIRVLVLIAFTGFFVGAVALGSAAALGGSDLVTRGWMWKLNSWDDDGYHHHRRSDAMGPDTTREIVWNGGDKLDVEIPADVSFTQVEGPGKLTISGPKDLVEKVILENGRLRIDEPVFHRGRLKVVVTAPGVRAFEASNNSELTVDGYRQDSLAIDASGSSEVTVRGEARTIRLDISGSSEVDLKGLTADEAVIDSSGSAETTVAPRNAARLNISGGSEVTLLTQPAKLETDISGGGKLNQPGAERTR